MYVTRKLTNSPTSFGVSKRVRAITFGSALAERRIAYLLADLFTCLLCPKPRNAPTPALEVPSILENWLSTP